MQPELARALAELDASTESFLAELEAMTPEQRLFRPAPDAWSPAMVVQHLALVEHAAVAGLQRRKPGRRPQRTLRQKLLYPIVGLVMRSSLKVRAPSRRVLPDADRSADESVVMWRAARAALRRALEPVGEAELGDEAFSHPVSGPADFREAMAFLVDHLEHHRRQIARIRRASGFAAAGESAR